MMQHYAARSKFSRLWKEERHSIFRRSNSRPEWNPGPTIASRWLCEAGTPFSKRLLRGCEGPAGALLRTAVPSWHLTYCQTLEQTEMVQPDAHLAEQPGRPKGQLCTHATVHRRSPRPAVVCGTKECQQRAVAAMPASFLTFVLSSAWDIGEMSHQSYSHHC